MVVVLDLAAAAAAVVVVTVVMAAAAAAATAAAVVVMGVGACGKLWSFDWVEWAGVWSRYGLHVR